jgi:hypothetical protein
MREIAPPTDYQEYTSFGSPLDLYTVKKSPARLLKVTTSGTITVKMSGSVGANRTLNVADGEELIGDFMSIESVTGVTRIRVGWN